MNAGSRHRAFTLASWAIARAERGEAVAIEIGVPARPILGQLIEDGSLRRALLILERDGAHARIAARPRRTDGVATITEFFEEDHRRLDELSAAMRASAREDPMRAIVLAQLLAWGLRRHVRIEEEVVFPLHEARTRFAETSAKMRVEHVALLTYVDRVEYEATALRISARRKAAAEHLLEAEAGLAAVLADHNRREEKVLFPLLDHTLTRAAREEALRKIVMF